MDTLRSARTSSTFSSVFRPVLLRYAGHDRATGPDISDMVLLRTWRKSSPAALDSQSCKALLEIVRAFAELATPSIGQSGLEGPT
jgi:hypothetical protein